MKMELSLRQVPCSDHSPLRGLCFHTTFLPNIDVTLMLGIL